MPKQSQKLLMHLNAWLLSDPLPKTCHDKMHGVPNAKHCKQIFKPLIKNLPTCE